ncbi:MAG: hypothetical protein AB7Q23_10180 [Hyphomonadaceae bacterium]
MSNKPSDAQLWEIACAAIEKVRQYSPDQRRAYFDSARFLPPMISTGQRGQVFTTSEGLSAIASIAEAWRTADPARKARIDPDRMRQIAHSEFGAMLAENDRRVRTDYADAVREYKQRLARRLDQVARDVEHYFACRVFERDDLPAFNVGPVRFQQREDWLRHVSSRAKGDVGWPDRVRRIWTRKRSWLDYLDRKAISRQVRRFLLRRKDWPFITNLRRAHMDLDTESVLEMVGECRWVAAVHVVGNELGRSGERAKYGVRLAIDALGLLLSASQASELRGPGDELHSRHTVTLSLYEGLDLNAGHHMDAPHLFTTGETAKKYIDATSEYREAAGWAISAVLDSDGAQPFSSLRRRWCDALYWFGEARRSSADFSALVLYGISIDVLSKGRGANGISDMLAGLFGIGVDDKLMKDGDTVRQIVSDIYEKGRSQFGHGGRPALIEDLPVSRATADSVAARALDLYLDRLRLYGGDDDIDVFLAALPDLTAERRKQRQATKDAAEENVAT